MRRRLLLVVALVAVAAGVLALLVLRGGARARRRPAATPALATPTPAPTGQIALLYPGPDGLLHPELVEVRLPEEPQARVRAIVERLLGEPPPGWPPAAPYPATLLDVFVDGRGVAYVDLSPPDRPLAGSSTELLFAYAVVDSILLNVPELRAVQLLFGGREVRTLTGHLDLSRPLVLDTGFVAGS